MNVIIKKRLLLLLVFVSFTVPVDLWAADVNPKIGEWEGEPTVSFIIKEKGEINDFVISVPLAMGICDIKIPIIPILKEGGIKFTQKGKMKSMISNSNEYFSITGKFKSPTSIEGKVKINICPDPEDKNNVIMLVPWEKEWEAKFKTNLWALAKEKDQIVLYDNPIIKFPAKILPYKEGNMYKISNLRINDNAVAMLDLEKKEKGECCVVLFFKTENEFIVVNFDSERDLTFHSSGGVLFGLSKVGKRMDVDTKKGSLSFPVTYKAFNTFDMSGKKGDLYVFVVKGQVYSNSALPGEQKDETAYWTSSNVLKTEFIFK